MKKNATMAVAAAVFLLYAVTAAAINLKPDKPQEHTGSLTVEHSGKKKKVEGARVVVTREQIRILPGKKSGVASRTVTAKGAEQICGREGPAGDRQGAGQEQGAHVQIQQRGGLHLPQAGSVAPVANMRLWRRLCPQTDSQTRRWKPHRLVIYSVTVPAIGHPRAVLKCSFTLSQLITLKKAAM